MTSFKSIAIGQNFYSPEGSLFQKINDNQAACIDPEDTCYQLEELAPFKPLEQCDTFTA